MKAKSHQQLGRYLAQKYMDNAPRRYIWAFLIGCTEPDKNPTTYFKGSIRGQWLRGHNWGNSQRYMGRISTKLEQKEQLRLLDFYKIGKLIHYTTDAFTYAHNESFHESLKGHYNYEILLQRYFIRYLANAPASKRVRYESVMDTIQAYHLDYACRPAGVHTDSRFTVIVCCAVLDLLLVNRSTGSCK